MNARAAARAIFDASLRAGEVRPLVARALGDVRFPARGALVVVGAGKASGAMAAAVEETVGDRIAGWCDGTFSRLRLWTKALLTVRSAG